MPAARLEAIEAQDWYEREAPGLGARFRTELDRQVERILANPLQFPLMLADIRRARLRRFPYGLYSSTRRCDLCDCLLPLEPRSRRLEKPALKEHLLLFPVEQEFVPEKEESSLDRSGQSSGFAIQSSGFAIQHQSLIHPKVFPPGADHLVRHRHTAIERGIMHTVAIT